MRHLIGCLHVLTLSLGCGEPASRQGLSDELVGVIIGSILGLAASIGLDTWKERRRVRGVRRAVRQELRESAYRFVALVHALERNHGRLNRELLQWVQTHASRYQGPNPSSGTLEATTALLALSDEEIATMGAAVAKGEPTNLPPEELLYTRAAVQDLHVFPELQVARVLDVLAQVRMYNETAAEWKENLRLTFEPGLSTANHSIARAKVRSNEEQAVKRGRNIIQRIAGLEQAFEDVTLRRRLTFPGARARISNVLRSLRARH